MSAVAPTRRMRRACGHVREGELGQASIEVVALTPLILILCLGLWELLLVAWAATEAENAARNAARSGADNPGLVARRSLSPGLRDGASTRLDGEQATVRVKVPLVVPGLGADLLTLSRRATVPPKDVG